MSQILVFGPSDITKRISAAIVDDSLTESDEMFHGQLTLIGSEQQRVSLSATTTLVTIIDNDQGNSACDLFLQYCTFLSVVVVGFVQTVAYVDEEKGDVTVSVAVLSGFLAETVSLFLTVVNGTASKYINMDPFL